MSKTLWNTIKIEVPNEMVNITKKDKVTVKKSLTKTNNVSKANKEPSIKIIPGNVNKPKIISDGKEWNIEELKIRLKKAKGLGKKNEGKELKKQIPKDKAAKIITKEIIFAQLKNKLIKLETKLENENLSLDYLQELARKVLKKRFTSANESYIDMARYTRKTMKELIIEFYKKKPKEMEDILKNTDPEDPQQFKIMLAQSRKK
jgi:hypothetical protein